MKKLRILSIFVLILQILISSCVKQEIPTLTNTVFSYSIKYNHSQEIPPDTEYFEVNDYKTIVDLVNNLDVSTDVSSLYNKAKALDVNTDKLSSLNARPTPDTSKINAINSENTSLNTEISSLLSSVNSSLSSLNTQKQSLANHINTITKKQYITYDIADKPDSIGSYFDKAYFLDLDLRNLLSDGVSLYAPDKDDVDQDNLKESWEVSQDRVEVLDPSDLFDSIKAYSDEIQTAKDLISDYQNNVFLAEDKLEAIQTLDSLVRNIKEHKALLLARAKKFNKDYETNFNDIKESEVELHQSMILPLALAMEQSGDFDDNTYLHKASSMTTQGLRTLSVKDWYDWTKTKYEVAKVFLNADLPKKEKILAIMLGYSKDEWLQFKSIDPQGATELINATAELVEAVGIPTTTTGAVLTFAGPVSKLFGKLSKVSASLLSKKLPANQAVYIKKLKDGIASVKATMNKWFGKYFPKGCLDGLMSTKSLQTQAIKNPSELANVCLYAQLAEALLKKIKINNTLRSKYIKYASNNHTIPVLEIISTKAFKTYNKKRIKFILDNSNTFNDPKLQNLLGVIDQKLLSFKNSAGVKVNKLKNHDLHFPDFETHAVGKVSINVIGDYKEDFKNAAQAFITNNPTLIPSGMTVAQFEKIRTGLGLVWHHHEDLNTMVLIDGRIHAPLGHWGSASILKRLTTVKFKDIWRTIVREYE